MLVCGVDFGTLSVRATVVDTGGGGVRGTGTASYPLHRRRDDPDFATQSHADHMRALAQAVRAAVAAAGVAGADIAALALDTTGSSVIPVDARMRPLDDYYLWCDHRAKREAGEITAAARRLGLEAIDWCGGVYSAEWGWAKLLHWLRHNESRRADFGSAFEHCDFVAATLCGIDEPRRAMRSVCAMGHKWMWNPRWNGLPPEEFWTAVDPLLAGVRARLEGDYRTSDRLAGELAPAWAAELGLRAGIPIPVGAFDAHWDAVGAEIRVGDVINVIGTSTCIIAVAPAARLIPGVCGVVPGSVLPALAGIEAGLSAVGDIFQAIAARAGRPLEQMSAGLRADRAGQTGLLRLGWDNGDRTVLVNPELRGITLGWHLQHTAEDELFAAMEGSALHTRIILDRMAEHGVPVTRVVNAGGIPPRNPTLNRIYANALGRPVLVPEGGIAGLGSAIFAAVAAGAFSSFENAQRALCPPHAEFQPQPREQAVYARLYELYRQLYFAFGTPAGSSLGGVLPALIDIASPPRAHPARPE